ncbi:hypothetical protein Tco_0632050, partial [Tanacetum coccineum]
MKSHPIVTIPLRPDFGGVTLVDSGFVVPVFSPGDDLIAYLNKAMAFLTAVASLRFPST